MSLLLDLLRDAHTVYSHAISRFLPSSKEAALSKLLSEQTTVYDQMVQWEGPQAEQQLQNYDLQLASALLELSESTSNESSSSVAPSASKNKFDTIINILKINAHATLENISSVVAQQELETAITQYHLQFENIENKNHFANKARLALWVRSQLNEWHTLKASPAALAVEASEIALNTQHNLKIAALEKNLADERARYASAQPQPSAQELAAVDNLKAVQADLEALKKHHHDNMLKANTAAAQYKRRIAELESQNHSLSIQRNTQQLLNQRPSPATTVSSSRPAAIGSPLNFFLSTGLNNSPQINLGGSSAPRPHQPFAPRK